MKNYKFVAVFQDKAILEPWVNKFSDLPENVNEALAVAESLGVAKELVKVKKISENEFNEKGVI